MYTPHWVIAGAIAYFCGSVPFGFLIARAKGVDLRKVGSGNIGATNAGRVLGRKWGLLCFVLDVVKGLAPVVGAGAWFGLLGRTTITPGEAGMWLGVAVLAIIGHVFPVWLGFRGGKGVATAFGAILGVWPFLTLPAVAALLTWLLFASTFRYVSLASMVAALALPLYFLLAATASGWPIATTWPFTLVTTLMALLIVLRHRDNMTRLAAGTERRLGG